MRVATRRIISRRLDAIPTEDGQLLLKLKRKKKGVCVCEKYRKWASAARPQRVGYQK